MFAKFIFSKQNFIVRVMSNDLKLYLPKGDDVFPDYFLFGLFCSHFEINIMKERGI